MCAAFSDDAAMIEMLGRSRWHRIAERYFAVQLDYSDTIFVAESDGNIIGALLARSPFARPSWHSLWMMVVMIRLLGRHYLESQRIGLALVERIPQQNHWYINQLAVLPRYQSTGIGKRLLATFQSLTATDLVCVDCEASLQGYYESSGFILLDTIPDHRLRLMVNRPIAL